MPMMVHKCSLRQPCQHAGCSKKRPCQNGRYWKSPCGCRAPYHPADKELLEHEAQIWADGEEKEENDAIWPTHELPTDLQNKKSLSDRVAALEQQPRMKRDHDSAVGPYSGWDTAPLDSTPPLYPSLRLLETRADEFGAAAKGLRKLQSSQEMLSDEMVDPVIRYFKLCVDRVTPLNTPRPYLFTTEETRILMRPIVEARLGQMSRRQLDRYRGLHDNLARATRDHTPLLFPIHYEDGFHWLLIIATRSRDTNWVFNVYDSMSTESGREFATEHCTLLGTRLNRLARAPFVNAALPFHTRSGKNLVQFCPFYEQPGGYECGAYMLMGYHAVLEQFMRVRDDPRALAQETYLHLTHCSRLKMRNPLTKFISYLASLIRKAEERCREERIRMFFGILSQPTSSNSSPLPPSSPPSSGSSSQ